jgi:hypothetical protein
LTAVRVGIKGYIRSDGKAALAVVALHDCGGDLMPRNPRIGHHWIQAAKGIQIAATKSYHSHLQQYAFVGGLRFRNFADEGLARLLKNERFHLSNFLLIRSIFEGLAGCSASTLSANG